MMIKKQTLSLLIILSFILTINSQERQGRKEKIKTLKIAYLTEELDLTANEAEKFWPLYNAHEKKLHEFRKSSRKSIYDKIKNENNLTEAKAKILVEQDLLIGKKIFAEREAFITKLSSILPYKKILKLQLSEKEFGRKLMRKYHKKPPRD